MISLLLHRKKKKIFRQGTHIGKIWSIKLRAVNFSVVVFQVFGKETQLFGILTSPAPQGFNADPRCN